MPATPLSTVLHSTLTKSRKNLIIASLRSNALMAFMFSSKRVEYEDGGHEITNPLMVGRNPNVGSYQYYDTVPVAQTSEFTTVTYGWSRVAGTVIISDQEEDENQGSAQIFKLVKAKVEALKLSLEDKYSDYAYGVGAGTDPYGLGNAVPTDPTTGTFGGIDRATEIQWRTSSYPFAGALNQTNIEEAMDDIMLDLTMKSDKPDLIVFGRNLMRIYRAAVRDKVVFALSETDNGKRMADLGFGGVSFNNIPIVYDEACGVNTGYFINSKYLRYHIMRHVNMKVKELVAPWNQDVTGRRIVTQLNLCLWKAYRTHAVITNA